MKFSTYILLSHKIGCLISQSKSMLRFQGRLVIRYLWVNTAPGSSEGFRSGVLPESKIFTGTVLSELKWIEKA